MYLTLEWNWFPAEQRVCFCLRLRNPKWKSCSDIHFIHFRWWQTVAAASSPHPSAPSQQLFNDKTVVLTLKVGTLVFPHRKLIRNQYGNRSRIGLISRIWTWEILKGATTMNKVRLVCVCEGEYRSRGVVIIKTLGAAQLYLRMDEQSLWREHASPQFCAQRQMMENHLESYISYPAGNTSRHMGQLCRPTPPAASPSPLTLVCTSSSSLFSSRLSDALPWLVRICLLSSPVSFPFLSSSTPTLDGPADAAAAPSQL